MERMAVVVVSFRTGGPRGPRAPGCSSAGIILKELLAAGKGHSPGLAGGPSPLLRQGTVRNFGRFVPGWGATRMSAKYLMARAGASDSDVLRTAQCHHPSSYPSYRHTVIPSSST